jgi:hypothetical protein
MMWAAGGEPVRVPDDNVNCDEPVFNANGTMLAMSVDETGVMPEQRAIQVMTIAELSPTPTPTATAGGGDTTFITTTANLTATATVAALPTATPSVNTVQGTTTKPFPVLTPRERITGGGWNRFAPQWVDEQTLVYAASAPDSRHTLFLFDTGLGVEQDIGAELQMVKNTYRYNGFGNPTVSPDGREIAVEAYRVDDDGTDLLLLDSQGNRKETIGEGYWNRPLAWGENGTLYYLTTECQSNLARHYSLYRRERSGEDQVVVAGITLETYGDAIALGDGEELAYVSARALPGGEGFFKTSSPYSPSTLWYWDFTLGIRSELFTAPYGITHLTR